MGQKVNSTIFRSSLNHYDCNYKYTPQNLEESTIFLYKNIEIQNYITQLFKNYNIIIKNFKIEHTRCAINILIYFYKLKSTTLINKNKSFNKNSTKQLISSLITKILILNTNLYLNNKLTQIKTQDLSKQFEIKITKNKKYLLTYKKCLRLFKKFLKNPLNKDLIKILFIVISERNSAQLLSEIISVYLTKNKKKHNFLFFLLKKVITSILTVNFSKIKGIKIVVNGRFNGAPRAKQKNIILGVVPLQSLNAKISYHNSTAFTQNGTFGIKVWVCEK